MFRKLRYISGFIFLLSNIALSGNRFVDSVFAEVDMVKGIKYRTAITLVGAPDTLLMDLYKPKNDTMRHRPLVVILHGGSFMTGSHDDGFCTATANYLAKRGFAAASIKYRLGIDLTTLADPAKIRQQFGAATYRAIQDTKAAVRFLKTIANSEQYKIDTANVFLCGYSAGAVTAVHYANMQIEEITTKMDTTGLGPIETGENISTSSSIKGYISFAGVIFDTTWIALNDVPFISFHGTNDATLPYTSGYALGMPTLPVVYGSYAIHTTADRLGITNKLIAYQNETHAFVETPGLLLSSLDSAVTFLYPLLGSASVLKQFLTRKFTEKGYVFNKNIVPDIYNLTGRKIGNGSRIPHGTYIANYRNIANEFLSIKKIFLKGK
jgi:poly(3-hydroxybutyrate) depolymerase